MKKRIVKIVLTGGPAAGKTTLISRILKEFKQDDGWKVVTVPESATELISQFGIKPFGNCVTMLEFQDFVIADQIHKEKLALKAAQMVPERNVLVIYDRALMDDKAYITDEEFRQTIAKFDGRTEQSVLANYDAVIHLVSCAKGAEFAYNLGNAARTETLEYAREMDDRTLRAWSAHPNLKIVDNSVDFEEKINRALREVYRIVGEPEPMAKKHKYLIRMPDLNQLVIRYQAVPFDMMQTYLNTTSPGVERRIRQQKNGPDYLYFYTEKHTMPDNTKWDTERPISQKEYIQYLMEGDMSLRSVHKTKYRFTYANQRFEIDIYPFSKEKAIMFRYAENDRIELPPEIEILQEVTGVPEYKNKQLAATQKL